MVLGVMSRCTVCLVALCGLVDGGRDLAHHVDRPCRVERTALRQHRFEVAVPKALIRRHPTLSSRLFSVR